MARMSFTTSLAERRIEKIQHLLRRSDCTVQEISDAIFLSKRWVYEYVNYLHLEKKVIHISEYKKVVRSNQSWFFIPVYCWGEAKDAKKPKALSASEKSKRYREHLEKGDERKQADKNKKQLSRMRIKRDWTASWIPTKQAA